MQWGSVPQLIDVNQFPLIHPCSMTPSFWRHDSKLRRPTKGKKDTSQQRSPTNLHSLCAWMSQSCHPQPRLQTLRVHWFIFKHAQYQCQGLTCSLPAFWYSAKEELPDWPVGKPCTCSPHCPPVLHSEKKTPGNRDWPVLAANFRPLIRIMPSRFLISLLLSHP